MDDRMAARIARRRDELRRRQVRRRRFFGLGVLVSVVLIVAYVVVSGGDERLDPGKVNPSPVKADSNQATAAEVGGAQPDSSWKPSRAPVPVLMYHVIGDPAGEVSLPDLYLSVDDFQEQVDWLEKNSYTAVTLTQVQDAWFDGATLPEKPIVLSFDDGYLGQYTEAMPILREKGWAGLLNLKAEGSDLSDKEVKKMIRAGWEVASHTINHLDLTTLDPATLETEVSGSKKMLEKDLGVKIENFCYPAGDYNEVVAAAVEAAGYRGATTVDPGLADRNEPFELKRIRISRDEGVESLAAALGS